MTGGFSSASRSRATYSGAILDERPPTSPRRRARDLRRAARGAPGSGRSAHAEFAAREVDRAPAGKIIHEIP
jgi:hypothetical protein